MLAQLLIRLCVLMVAAFGPRPCDVSAFERERASLFVTLQAPRSLDEEAARPASPAWPTLGTLFRTAPAVRGAPRSGGSAASAPTAAMPEWALIARAAPRESDIEPRRTPCPGCGDGTPYDATAPPPPSDWRDRA